MRIVLASYTQYIIIFDNIFKCRGMNKKKNGEKDFEISLY